MGHRRFEVREDLSATPAGDDRVIAVSVFPSWAFRLTAQFVLLAISSAVSLVLSEMFLRLFAPQTLGLAWDTADGLAVHIPRRSMVYQREEFRSSVRINALGFRGKEWLVPKPPGTYRILALGDSMTEGLQVDETDLFVSRIETAFADSTPRVEVLNSGVSGYATADEITIYDSYGPRLQPDLVIVVFCLVNDTRGDVLDGRCHLDGDTAVCQPPQVRPPVGAWINHAKSIAGSYSHLYQLLRTVSSGARWERFGLRDVVPALSTADQRFGPDRHWEPAPDYLVKGYALSFALLRELRDRVRAHGATLWLALVPFREQIENERWHQLTAEAGEHALVRDAPQRAFRRAAETLGIPVIDPYASFRAKSDAGEKLFWQVDMHFTAKGHAEFARAIIEYMRETGIPLTASAGLR